MNIIAQIDTPNVTVVLFKEATRFPFVVSGDRKGNPIFAPYRTLVEAREHFDSIDHSYATDEGVTQ